MNADAPTSVQQRLAASDGFIVVAALWILAMLATLAAIYSIYVVDTATAMSLNGERLQAEALVTAGLDLTVLRMASTAGERPPVGKFTFRLGGAEVDVDFRTETARIDLNLAPRELLAGMFAAIGATPELANEYANRIIGWRSKAAANSGADESANYRTAGLAYGPRLGPFPHPEELSLVLGLPPVMVERALPLVTTYSGQAAINPIAATPEVLAALPGMTPDRLSAVMAQREIAPKNTDTLLEMLGPARDLAGVTATKTDRVNVRVTLPTGRRLGAEVVIFVSDAGDEPYGIISWHDDFDEASEAPARPAAR